MSNPDIDKNMNKAKEILEIYNSINDANVRKLSYEDTDLLDVDEKRKVNLQLEFDSIKQSEQFVSFIGESAEYITDVLVKSLQNDINKDTLWRLFGDIIFNNIKNNLEGTKICENCKERFKLQSNLDRNVYCNKCKRDNELEKKRKYWNKINIKNEVV
jgi:hypothetical protein